MKHFLKGQTIELTIGALPFTKYMGPYFVIKDFVGEEKIAEFKKKSDDPTNPYEFKHWLIETGFISGEQHVDHEWHLGHHDSLGEGSLYNE